MTRGRRRINGYLAPRYTAPLDEAEDQGHYHRSICRAISRRRADRRLGRLRSVRSSSSQESYLAHLSARLFVIWISGAIFFARARSAGRPVFPPGKITYVVRAPINNEWRYLTNTAEWKTTAISPNLLVSFANEKAAAPNAERMEGKRDVSTPYGVANNMYLSSSSISRRQFHRTSNSCVRCPATIIKHTKVYKYTITKSI